MLIGVVVGLLKVCLVALVVLVLALFVQGQADVDSVPGPNQIFTAPNNPHGDGP